jgi:hypothetical protein
MRTAGAEEGAIAVGGVRVRVRLRVRLRLRLRAARSACEIASLSRNTPAWSRTSTGLPDTAPTTTRSHRSHTRSLRGAGAPVR